MKKDPWKYQETFGLVHAEHGVSIVEMETRRILVQDVAAIGLTPAKAKAVLELLNTVKAYDPEED